MTEQEWLASTDPEQMLNFLLGRKNRGAILTWLGVGRRSSAPRPVWVTDRKLRWFAVACCRRIWFLLRDERSQRAIETCERYADGLASEEELAASQAQAGAAADSMETSPAAEYMTVALGMGPGATGKSWSGQRGRWPGLHRGTRPRRRPPPFRRWSEQRWSVRWNGRTPTTPPS
jgi:hypothetical protein